ncbi:MAG: polysaccharide deacetylase family protein [Actinomycetota bacterium]
MHIENGGKRAIGIAVAGAILVLGVLAINIPAADNGSAVDAGQDAAGTAGIDSTTPTPLDTTPAKALAVRTDESREEAAAPPTTAASQPAEEDVVADSTAADGTETTATQTEDTVAADPPPAGDRPVIHLTFDDGPSELTPRVMDLVERYGGKATFFVMGTAVEDHPDIAREIVARGHAIANHSYNHMDWRQPGAREDIILTQGIIESVTGVVPSCARPPFGADNPQLIATLNSLGMASWRWDLSAEDHTDAMFRVEQTLNTIDDAINIWGAEGKIFLQHDSDLQRGPSIDGLEAWLEKNADRYEFKVIDGCLDYQ